MCVQKDDIKVESRINVFQEVKGLIEHKVDINVISIIGPGQDTDAKIVKRRPGVLQVTGGKLIPSMLRI